MISLYSFNKLVYKRNLKGGYCLFWRYSGQVFNNY